MQSPHFGSSTKQETTDVDVKDSLESGPYPGIFYIYNLFDLYSQLHNDNSWQRQCFNPTKAGKILDLKSNQVLEARGNQSTKNPVFQLIRLMLQKVNPKQQHVMKHGVIREVVPSLHVVAEETVNDNKFVSTIKGVGMSNTPDTIFSNAYETMVIKQNYMFSMLCIFSLIHCDISFAYL